MITKGNITEDIDIMVENGTKFYCSLMYEHCSLFKFNFFELLNFIYEKRPTLRYREFQIFIGNAVVDVNNNNIK